jgi:SAM-dependent methyltransferase
MDDLSLFPDDRFDLVLAIGVFHAARSRGEWERAAAETARVLRPGGLLLFNQFTPETDPTGEGLRPVPGEQDLYEGMPAGRAVLLDAARLDAAWAAHGLRPFLPGETKRVELEDGGRRVSVNALYIR